MHTLASPHRRYRGDSYETDHITGGSFGLVGILIRGIHGIDAMNHQQPHYAARRQPPAANATANATGAADPGRGRPSTR
jgi:hypothetical protein